MSYYALIAQFIRRKVLGRKAIIRDFRLTRGCVVDAFVLLSGYAARLVVGCRNFGTAFQFKKKKNSENHYRNMYIP